LLIKPSDSLKFIALNLTMGYIALHLAAQAPSVDYWHYKARNQFKTGYLDIADADYARVKSNGGIPFDLDGDGTIQPAEQTISAPLILGRA
jgi:hypothetical protein